jgi:hypothetical protein
MQEQIL